ncbi:MAG: FtsX-like permease family protein [Acidobacteriota bacterium]
MQSFTLIKRNLTHYWRTNLAVITGVSIAVAVLAGALLVGDSVRASLRRIFLSRLGNTDIVITGASFFRERLADDVRSHKAFNDHFSDACPLIVYEALVAHEKSGRRGVSISVYGVDERFWRFHRLERADRTDDAGGILVSPSLARELGATAGDTLLVTLKKPSAIPAETLQGRRDEPGRALRLNMRETLSVSDLGEFSIRPQQGEVRAVFVSLRRLQRDLEQSGRVNAILVSEKNRDAQSSSSLESILRNVFQLEDLGIKTRALDSSVALESEAAIISDALADTARVASNRMNASSSGVLTYLANTIRANGREVPYSVVTALDGNKFRSTKDAISTKDTKTVKDTISTKDTKTTKNTKTVKDTKEDSSNQLFTSSPPHLLTSSSSLPPIILNDWAASDLNAKAGDQVELEYFIWADEGRLVTKKAAFRLAAITPIAGDAADRNLVPDYPGITGTESMGEWDPPFPMELGRIRPKDEDYWDRYRATPKAFLLLEDGQKLWQSRYGKLTSLRIYPTEGVELQATLSTFDENLKSTIDPLLLGLTVNPTRAEGLAASRGATDFGEYFAYFSFFLVVSALLLAALFFKLGVEQRLREIGALRAMGFPTSRIRSMFLIEGAAMAIAGSLAGLLLATGYGGLMMYGLRTWWVGAVGTTQLELHITATSLIYGLTAGILAALLCIAWTIRAVASYSPRSLLTGSIREAGKKASGKKSSSHLFTSSPLHLFIFGLLGIAMVAAASAKVISQAAGFFGGGVMLLVALLFYESFRIRKRAGGIISGNGLWPVSRLGFRNITYRPGRSILCIALIASATFIIVSVDAFRRDASSISLDQKSGTGGFALLGESLLPLISNPNTDEGKENLNLLSDVNADLREAVFYRFRLKPGEDTSCLNLYQPRDPRILAPTADFTALGRFAFQSSLAATADEKANPWLLLDRAEADGAIPVIADANSLTYVLHLAVGDEFVLSRGVGAPVRLRIVAALSDSIFQGEFLMSEKNFVRLFPETEGYRFFLVDCPREKISSVAARLEDQLSDYGLDVVSTVDRLASFHQVENTYLSTFQTLGGLGLLLGTLGLATVLLRNVLERRREMALLQAVGYNSRHFTVMVVAENFLMLASGLTIGATCAAVAIAPAIISRGGAFSVVSVVVLLLAVLIAGLASSIVAVRAAARAPLLASLRSE